MTMSFSEGSLMTLAGIGEILLVLMIVGTMEFKGVLPIIVTLCIIAATCCIILGIKAIISSIQKNTDENT